MAVICERMVILLQRSVDMIDKTLTVHSIPNLSHLERTEHCYEVINAKAKFWPRGNLEFGFLSSFRMFLCVCVCVCVCVGGGGGGGGERGGGGGGGAWWTRLRGQRDEGNDVPHSNLTDVSN